MKAELTNTGYWLATGRGRLRPIVAEGGTRREAVRNFAQSQCAQILEQQRVIRRVPDCGSWEEMTRFFI